MCHPITKKTTISPHGQVTGVQLDGLKDNVLTWHADMLGFKLEAPRREGSMSDKVRPIYLDMQVLSLSRYVKAFVSQYLRQRPP